MCPSGPCLNPFVHFSHRWEIPTFFGFLVHQLAVYSHIEYPALTFYKGHFGIGKIRRNFGRHTGGLREIISHHTIFYGHIHLLFSKKVRCFNIPHAAGRAKKQSNGTVEQGQNPAQIPQQQA
jgi:hypothetical protein